MAGVTGFTVDVTVFGQAALGVMQDRLRDFSPAWDQIIQSYLKHNVSKFEAARGGELTGVFHDGGDVYWDPVSEEYWAWKRDKAEDEGWPGEQDWRMVLTGATMRSLTDRGDPNWFEFIGPQSLQMGSLTEGAFYQFERAQAVFLDEQDRSTIQREVFDWLQGNRPYNPLPWAEAASAKAPFEVDVSPEGGI